MKVIVTKPLNVRVGKPRLNAPCYQYLAPGSELEVDDRLFTGDKFEGLDTWLKDAANNFYWIGGVDHPINNVKKNEILFPQIDGKTTFRWFNQLNIGKIWSEYDEKGKRAKVVVLDTGFQNANIDLQRSIQGSKIIIEKKDYKPEALVINDQSDVGHGSRCAALVGARNTSKWIVGIAPECELLVGKISHNLEILDFNYIINGVKWALDQNADIIAISYAVEAGPDFNVIARNNEFTELLKNKNALVFAAAGNTSAAQPNGKRYPAAFDKCISVGASNNACQVDPLTLNNNKTILHAPGIDIESFGRAEVPSPASGTSFSTPIVAAIAALAVSRMKKKNGFDKDTLLQLMQETADPIPNQSNKKIINPENLFKKL